MKSKIIIVFSMLCAGIYCQAANKVQLSSSKTFAKQVVSSNTDYVIGTTFDLKGQIVTVPKGCKLIFKGGTLKNGILVGNDTGLEYSGAIFNGIKIKGTWNVPEIKSSMFKDISKQDKLKDLFALLSSSHENKLTIENGSYKVSTSASDISALDITSNTEVVVNGTVELVPNDQKRSYVFLIEGCDNVILRGSGIIKGDKDSHKGKDGEWGYGVCIRKSSNVTVKDLNIQNCWGDCICVAANSENVLIENCALSNARRQGISFCSGINSEIKNCDISNISGTAPEFGIDVEPDANGVVNNLLIDGIKVRNCGGGIMGHGGAKNAKVSGVTISNCTITGSRKQSIYISSASDYKVVNCSVSDGKYDPVYIVDSSNIEFDNNKISFSRSGHLINFGKNGVGTSNVIFKNNELTCNTSLIRDCSNIKLLNNKITCSTMFDGSSDQLEGLTISNNEISGMVSGKFKNCSISGNTITSDNSTPLSISGKGANTINGNSIKYTGTKSISELVSVSSTGNKITNNVLTPNDNVKNGINLKSKNNTASGNTATRAFSNGGKVLNK